MGSQIQHQCKWIRNWQKVVFKHHQANCNDFIYTSKYMSQWSIRAQGFSARLMSLEAQFVEIRQTAECFDFSTPPPYSPYWDFNFGGSSSPEMSTMGDPCQNLSRKAFMSIFQCFCCLRAKLNEVILRCWTCKNGAALPTYLLLSWPYSCP